MSHETAEMASQAAQLIAARVSEEGAMNAERLARWQMRYWHRCISAPIPTEPPTWPAKRSSIPLPSNVTRIPKRRT